MSKHHDDPADRQHQGLHCVERKHNDDCALRKHHDGHAASSTNL